MVNPLMPGPWTVALGEGAELLADKYAITPRGTGRLRRRIASTRRRGVARWSVRTARSSPSTASTWNATSASAPTRRVETLARLRPVFRDGGTVTAGNSSPMNDGAAAVVLADERGAERLGRRPLARVAARATAGVEPQWYGIGPVEAANVALRRAGIGWGDLDAVELNEAFAAQSLACLREWPELDPAVVNPLGGAIAIGHPLGASGARILTTLVHHLARTGGRWGLAAMCIGVGQGIAVVVESAEV